MSKRKNNGRRGGVPTDYSTPFYSECMDVCLGCASEKCYGELRCARLRNAFIQEIEAANGKAVMINGYPAYTLDNGRLVYIGRTAGSSRDKSTHSAVGYYADTGEKVLIVTDGLYFSAARFRISAIKSLKDEIELNPNKNVNFSNKMRKE